MTKDIELALSLGKLKGAKALLHKEYCKQDRQAFIAQLQSEYDALYKTVEVLVDAVLDENNIEITPATSYMDYVEGCISFSEYQSETRVVTLAVEATYDADGVELTPYIPEVTEPVRPYIQPDTLVRVNGYMTSKYAELRKNEYPDMEEFMDAWVKDDTVALEEYRQKCLAVKLKYPKGVQNDSFTDSTIFQHSDDS